jgi:cell division protein FtsI (penicillin-binding protein 3)
VNKTRTEGGWVEYLTDKRNAGNKYLRLMNGVTYSDLEYMKSFPIFNKDRFTGGFYAEERFKRYKPFKSLAFRTIGYVNQERKSFVGLEGYFDKTLAGESGKRLMYKLGQGNWMPIHDLTEIEPKKGLDIVSTIDVNIQDVTHQALYNALSSQDAEYGTAIVMEVKTGAIKAIANLTKHKDDWRERLNNGIGRSYEPGSTYKLASIMTLLEDGYVELEDLIEIDSGKYQFYEDVMEDSGKESFVTDTTTVRRAFEISSNVGIAKLVHQHYNKNERSAKKFINRLKSFYLHLPTGIELKGEPTPYIKEPYNEEDLWSGTTLPWMSTGYEVTLTPLQLLTFYNAVANDGTVMKPYLVSEIQQEGNTLERFVPTVIKRRIASRTTIRDAKALLEGVVERGTAQKLRSNRYRFAAKTGTSQINYHKLKPRSEIKHVASFAGYFPAENPIYSCIVVISDPRIGSYYGGDVAGPVFRQIADKCFEIQPAFYNSMELNYTNRLKTEALPHNDIGYRPDFESVLTNLEMDYTTQTKNEWSVIKSLNDSLKLKRRTVPEKRVPNVVGMGLRDALYLLENKGLQVKVVGVGKVVRQSIIPGTRIRGQKIKIFLG